MNCNSFIYYFLVTLKMGFGTITDVIDKSVHTVTSTYKRIDDKVDFYKHGHDCLAGLATASPLFAFYENVIAGMSDMESMITRATVAVLTVAGLGSVYARGRDKFRDWRGITQEDTEVKQGWNDFLYTAGFNVVLAPIIYSLAQAELQELAIGTIIGIGLSLPNGYVVGRATDIMRDLVDIAPSKRIPKTIQNLPKKTKKVLAYTTSIVLLASTFGIYALTPPKADEVVPQQEPLKQTGIPYQEWI